MVVQGPADSRTNSTETYVAPPFHYGDEAFEVVRPAPHLGEHTAEVLAEFGFEAGTVDAWQEQHVIMQWK
jgi:crotonobetainyl-CoA:carnitine CoA-transferase CaiB-like acyl-CoA transferase